MVKTSYKLIDLTKELSSSKNTKKTCLEIVVDGCDVIQASNCEDAFRAAARPVKKQRPKTRGYDQLVILVLITRLACDQLLCELDALYSLPCLVGYVVLREVVSVPQ